MKWRLVSRGKWRRPHYILQEIARAKQTFDTMYYRHKNAYLMRHVGMRLIYGEGDRTYAARADDPKNSGATFAEALRAYHAFDDDHDFEVSSGNTLVGLLTDAVESGEYLTMVSSDFEVMLTRMATLMPYYPPKCKVRRSRR